MRHFNERRIAKKCKRSMVRYKRTGIVQGDVDINHFTGVELAVVVLMIDLELFCVHKRLVGRGDKDFLPTADPVFLGRREMDALADGQMWQGDGLTVSGGLDNSENLVTIRKANQSSFFRFESVLGLVVGEKPGLDGQRLRHFGVQAEISLS